MFKPEIKKKLDEMGWYIICGQKKIKPFGEKIKFNKLIDMALKLCDRFGNFNWDMNPNIRMLVCLIS